MRQLAFCLFAFLVGAMLALPASAAMPQPALHTSEPIQRQSRDWIDLVQQRQCWERRGPFVTQDTAWQRLREAQAQGYAVSNGIVPYYEGSSRFYCFFVYYNC